MSAGDPIARLVEQKTGVHYALYAYEGPTFKR